MCRGEEAGTPCKWVIFQEVGEWISERRVERAEPCRKTSRPAQTEKEAPQSSLPAVDRRRRFFGRGSTLPKQDTRSDEKPGSECLTKLYGLTVQSLWCI